MTTVAGMTTMDIYEMISRNIRRDQVLNTIRRFGLAFCSLILVGCVSSSKYRRQVDLGNKMQGDVETLRSEKKALEENLAASKTENKKLEMSNTLIERQIIHQRGENKHIEERLLNLQADVEI